MVRVMRNEFMNVIDIAPTVLKFNVCTVVHGHLGQ